ncbi:hypothetical protein [Helicobacter fennelliae]
MQFSLENASDELVKAFKSMAKASGAKLKVQTSPQKNSEQKDSWQNEYKKLIKDYKAGKIKAHKNTKEAFEEAGLL